MSLSSIPNQSLRPLTEDDFAQVLRIEQTVHIAPWTEDHFRAEMSKSYSQVLILTDDETDSVVSGYIVFWMMFEECQILNVAVDLPFRGLGLAKKMIRQVISLAGQQGVKRVILDVRKGNLPAVQLYQKIGFVITRVQKKFYSNGEDAYQMSLSIETDPITF